MSHPPRFSYRLSLALTLLGALSACGEAVIEPGRGIDTTQAVNLSQALTPGSKGPQELSGSLHQLVHSRGTTSLRPAAGELLLSRPGSEIKVSVMADGSFSLPQGLADGDYALSARLESNGKAYQETFAPLRLRQGQPDKPLTLVSDLVALQGQVRLEGQAGAADVEIRVSGSALSTTSQADGRFDLGEVPLSLLKGRELLIQKPNFAAQSHNLGQSVDIGGLARFLAAPELKSLVPLASNSVLLREAGRVLISERELPQQDPGQPRSIEQTIEGSFGDGPADQAGFNRPVGLAEAPDGSVYVSDSRNHRIRRLGRDGQVTTLAGESLGFADGLGAAARFNLPQGLARDAAGNLYVADTGNHAIRKISPAGQVSTLAGGGSGDADGLGKAARFNLPTDLGIDAAGNLYVLDFANRAIRRISPAGRVETVYRSDWQLRGIYADSFALYLERPDYYPSDGQQLGPENARLMVPVGLAVTPAGQIYVSDEANGLVFKIEKGKASYFAGNSRPLYREGFIDIYADQLRFWQPRSLSCDAAGNLYLADSQHIYRFDAQGAPSKLVGLTGKTTGYRDQARFQRENLFAPGALLPRSDGSLTISDRYSQGIYRLYPCEQERPAACAGEPYYSRYSGEQFPWLSDRARYGSTGFFSSFMPDTLPQPGREASNPIQLPVEGKYPPAYVLTLENRSAQLKLGPGFTVSSNGPRDEYFSAGQSDRGRGLEAFAEEGAIGPLNHDFDLNPGAYYHARSLTNDLTRVLMPGQMLSVLVDSGTYLHLNLRLTDSNDRFLSFGPHGLPLQQADGRWVDGDVSARLGLWDAGTEVDEPLGQGPNQPARQPFLNSGDDEGGVVRQLNEPELAGLLRVTLTPLPQGYDQLAWAKQYLTEGGWELSNPSYTGPRLEQP